MHLAGLRSALQPGLPDRCSGQHVLRRGSGYRLAVATGNVDARRFAALVDRGRARLAEGDAVEAARLLTTALGLWRGEPYADWPGASFAESERRTLSDLHAAAGTALREARLLLPDHPAPSTAPDTSRFAAASWIRPERDAATSGAAPVRSVPATAVPVVRGDVAVRLPGRPGRWPVGVLAAVLVGGLVATGSAVRAQHEGQRATSAAAQAATEADVNRLADLSTGHERLDVALLLAAEAVRLADTPASRAGLLGALATHYRAVRSVPTLGSPRATVLAGGGRTLAFDTGAQIVAWSTGTTAQPRVVMDEPGEWGRWSVAAPSPTADEIMAAGESRGLPWLRMVSLADGTARLLQAGDALGGIPVGGAVSADGRHVLLVVATVAGAARNASSRWQLMDVDARSGATRTAGIGGSLSAPVETLTADFAADARSFVLYSRGGRDDARLVDVPGGGITPIAQPAKVRGSMGFRALPSGAAQLWADGTVALIDRSGATVQRLDRHSRPVWDVVVSPDGTWAATAGEDGEVFRWAVDPATGRWSNPEALPGHVGRVADLEVDAAGARLFTVGLDSRVIVWDMRPSGGSASDVRPGDPAAWVDRACAVAGRDFSPGEWQHYLPGRPWQPTCSDLSGGQATGGRRPIR
jgi:hypothetical protein